MPINQFSDYLSLEKKYSINTIKSYANDLNKLIDYFSEQGSAVKLSQLKKRDIREYLAYLSRLGYKAKTINRNLSSFRTFYDFLIKIGEIKYNPASNLKGLKSQKEIQIPFSKKEMESLFYGNVFKNDFSGVRDKLIMETLYQTGIRKSELINIKVSDLDLEAKLIKIKGKRNKQRLIPITDSLVSLIKKYIEESPFNLINTNKLLRTDKGEVLYPKFVYNTVRKYMSLVSSKQKKSPHMLRHSIATHLLQNGAEINSVKELLGHSGLVSTQVYTHQNIGELKKMFNKTHPRELKK